MSDIQDWLAAQGLARYAPAFEQAEIDVGTLALLTEEDLREIGLPLGPRRKILSVRDAAASAAEAPDSDRARAGERRQITVMFVDLVGSTNMSTRIVPSSNTTRSQQMCGHSSSTPMPPFSGPAPSNHAGASTSSGNCGYSKSRSFNSANETPCTYRACQ